MVMNRYLIPVLILNVSSVFSIVETDLVSVQAHNGSVSSCSDEGVVRRVIHASRSRSYSDFVKIPSMEKDEPVILEREQGTDMHVRLRYSVWRAFLKKPSCG